ncbi:MAG: HRDC domain-containing protein [Spirochaetia bacterium]|jgi:ribonuclease D|nr:HRDC domain-containing protein [Spirochaetia bacterium]
MKEYTLISTDQDLLDYRKHLDKNNIEIVAMDFEGEFNLHIYGETLCLIQIFDGTTYFVIDPYSVSREELAKTLEDRKVMKIFYDAISDSKLVYKQYGIKMQAVYDLKLLVDILDFEKKGLDAVISRLLGITIEKKKKFQQYNWTLRPVDKDAMQYALSDVEHLFVLKKMLFELVEKNGSTEELIYTIIKKSVDFDKKTIPGILKSFEYKKLKSSEKNLLKKIFDIREEIARELNVPPNLVMNKSQLFSASKNFQTIKTLEFNRRIPRNIRNKFIEQMESI